MTRDQLIQIARGGVERSLADVAADYDSEEAAADAIYDEAFTLGFDALIDKGVDPMLAAEIARHVAQLYAQP